MAEGKKAERKKKLVSRREFLAGSGLVIVAGALAACTPKAVTNTVTETVTSTLPQELKWSTTTSIPPASTVTSTLPAQTVTVIPPAFTKTVIPPARTTTMTETTTLPPTTETITEDTPVAPAYPASAAYLVYNSLRCGGCLSCMLACSLAHSGEASLSLSRIQISRDVLMRYPYDMQMGVCRQCPEPLCVENCPVGAAHIDTENGNVRVIDETKCIGCGTCLRSCPHEPHRTVWNPVTLKSSKCDLCITAPYYSKTGGPTGTPACIAVCPQAALSLVYATPNQTDINGYDVGLTPQPPPTTTNTITTTKTMS